MAQETMRTLLLIICIFSTPLEAATVVLTKDLDDGVIKLEIDDALVSPSAVERYLVVHPVALDSKYFIGDQLLLCIDKNPIYLKCGTRDYRDSNMIANGQKKH